MMVKEKRYNELLVGMMQYKLQIIPVIHLIEKNTDDIYCLLSQSSMTNIHLELPKDNNSN